MTEADSDSAKRNKRTIISLAIVVGVLIIAGVLWSNMKDAEQETEEGPELTVGLEAGTEVTINAQQVVETEVTTNAQQVVETEATTNAQQVVEAKRMMEKALEEEAETLKTEVKQLNERLQAEVKARKEAEQANSDLESQILALKNTLKEAEAKRAILVANGSTAGDQYQALLAEIKNARYKLGQLASEQQPATASYQNTRRRQIETEEAILDMGGIISDSDYVILSPYYKRRSALLWDGRNSKVMNKQKQQ